MTWSYDLATNSGKVRLLIQDNVETYEFFSDEEIDAFLTMAADLDGDVVRNASASALESWSSNQVLILKVVELLDLKIDGASVAREMRQRAKALRDEATSASSYAGFEIAEMALGPFSIAEQLRNKAIEDS